MPSTCKVKYRTWYNVVYLPFRPVIIPRHTRQKLLFEMLFKKSIEQPIKSSVLPLLLFRLTTLDTLFLNDLVNL